MRANPVFSAAQELKNDKKLKPQILNDYLNTRYCLIEFPSQPLQFILDGLTYQSDGSSHLSAYEQYHIGEKYAKTAYHFTWYGKASEKRIVIHVYFNSAQMYLYTSATDRDSKENLSIYLLPNEISKLRLYCDRVANGAVNRIYRQLQKQYQEASDKSSDLMNQLAKAFSPNKIQSERYLRLARDTLSAIKEKDRWSFGKSDPQGRLLAGLIERLESKENIVPTSLNTSPALYKRSNETKKSNVVSKKKKIKQKPKNKGSKKPLTTGLPFEVEKELHQVDIKFKEIEESKTNISEIIVDQYRYLEKRLEEQRQSTNPLDFEFEFNLYYRLSRQQDIISQAFHKALGEGDDETVRLLSEYVDHIKDYSVLKSMLRKNNVSLCRFIFENYSESITYFNFIVFIEKSKEKDVPDFYYSHLILVLFMPNSLELFTLMLECGVNCHIDPGLTISTLDHAVLEQKYGHVKALLDHGVDPNPNYDQVKPIMISCNNSGSFEKQMALLEQSPQQLMNSSQSVIPSAVSYEGSPLPRAALSGDVRITRLLLEYHAPVDEVVNGFNILGVVCCTKNHKPSSDMIRLLVEFGANINFLQTRSSTQQKYTCLSYVAEKGDLELVKLLMELGADPNVIITLPMECEAKDVMCELSALFTAVIKDQLDVVSYLLDQGIKSINLDHVVLTFSLLVVQSVSSLSFANDENEKCILKIRLQENGKREKICHLLQNTVYQSAGVAEAISKMMERGNKYYQNKDYFNALIYFFPGVFFMDGAVRHKAIYNCGCCLYILKEYDNALKFFKAACENISIDPETFGKAKNMLKKTEEKLNPISESTLKFH